MWPWTTTLALAAAYAAGFVAGRAVEVATSGVFGLIAAVLAATAAYIGAFVLAGGVRSRDRERATSVVASLRGRRAASVS